MNFNVYMGYDRRGEDNTFRVGALLKELEADVAVLQVRLELPRCFLSGDVGGGH